MSTATESHAQGGNRRRFWRRRQVVGLLMNMVILAAAMITALTAGVLAEEPWPRTWGAEALKLFALWCLSFLPGWLYVRFLGMRAKALWNEYVLNLHRLGWDRPWNLPEPPVTSEFHARWERNPNGGPLSTRPADNIYRQKFEAYYGRQVSRAATADPRGTDEPEYLVSAESLFPVFLATAVLAVGWSATLWDTRLVTAPSSAWDVLKFAFLGAYAFVLSMLIRRFFQNDLRPSAYASSVSRIILVLLIVAVMHQLVGAGTLIGGNVELGTAFLVGFFPLVGLQLIQRSTSKALRRLVPPLTSEYPLDQLDGLNLWYEARLLEEGVEDMQNLTTMNLVDVILHTRVPTGRLVDWTDQAFLLIHLDRADRAELNEERRNHQGAANSDPDAPARAESGAAARVALRKHGIRSATDLLKVFSVEQSSVHGELPRRRFVWPKEVKRLPLAEDQLRLLVAVLGAEPGLAPIWNWHRNGVPATGCPITVPELRGLAHQNGGNGAGKPAAEPPRVA